MEYVQMTLNDWMNIKQELEKELRGAAAGFVRIGYLLRKIEETKGYENDGSKSLAEWAKDNYGLSATAVSRFMKINERYSIDGYSDQLRLEYANYGSAKLSEMLALPDKDLEMVSPDMKRDDIREIRKFSKEMEKQEKAEPIDEPIEELKEEAQEEPQAQEEAPAAGLIIPADPNHSWIVEFFRENGEVLNELYCSSAFKNNDTDAMKEIVNPSGSRVFRHKLTMVSMLDNRIMVKQGMGSPAPMSWLAFFEITFNIFKEVAQGAGTYKNAFGHDPGEEKNEKAVHVERKEAPAQKKETGSAKKEERRGSNVPEQPTVPPMPKPAEGIAPAQKQPADTVNDNEKADSTIEETEPEQVEIDEILPAPTSPDKLRDLKDRFNEALNTLRMMCDVENFESMDGTIERLSSLKEKMIIERSKHG